jgi:hypothetical protein
VGAEIVLNERDLRRIRKPRVGHLLEQVRVVHSGGWLRIRPRITHKPGNGVVRARLVISPTIPRLARPAILL